MDELSIQIIERRREENNHVPLCPSCHEPMEKVTRLSNGKNKLNGDKYKRIRYYCYLCEVSEMQYAGGFRDEFIEPNQALEDVKKMYDQDEDART